MSRKQEESAPTRARTSSSGGVVEGVSFEVFGRVQKVFFRKNTKKAALKFGITGWVMNTDRGTVVGEAFGSSASMDKMKHWLREVGSKKSRIDKCVFKNGRKVDAAPYKKFTIRR